MFMVSEAETGYICGFEVYTGKGSNIYNKMTCNMLHQDNIYSYGSVRLYKITGQRPSCVF